LDEEEAATTIAPSESGRTGRKFEAKDTEGRFSIKEKLCSLGLADVGG